MVILRQVAWELLRDACPRRLSNGGCEVDRRTGVYACRGLAQGEFAKRGVLMHVGLRMTSRVGGVIRL